MMARRTDPDVPMGKLTPIKDALPPPGQLVMPEDTVKVTLLLSKSSVRFFKHQAAHHRVKYQRMIRELVDRYARQHASGSHKPA